MKSLVPAANPRLSLTKFTDADQTNPSSDTDHKNNFVEFVRRSTDLSLFYWDFIIVYPVQTVNFLRRKHCKLTDDHTPPLKLGLNILKSIKGEDLVALTMS